MRARNDGFSLLELLVVVVIIGLGVAVVGLSVGDNKPQALRNDARDFANYTALVEEESVLSREPWGVQIYREHDDSGTERIAYRFLRLTDNGWIPDHPRDIPAGAHFDDNVDAELQVEGDEQLIEPLPKTLNEAAPNADMTASQDGKKASANTPTIWLAPGGDVTPFTLRLHFDGENGGPVVRSDPLGRIKLDLKDDDNE